jgi:hypothetical protein
MGIDFLGGEGIRNLAREQAEPYGGPSFLPQFSPDGIVDLLQNLSG